MGGLNARLNRWLHLGSLAATAWFVWVNSLAPRLENAPLTVVLYQAGTYFLLACAGAALLVCCAYVTVSRGGARIRSPGQALAVTVWFAPAMFLAASFTAASMAASLLLVVSTSHLLAQRWLTDTRVGFATPRARAWRFAMAAVASASIHAGFLAMGAGWVFLAGVSWSASATVLTTLAAVTGAFAPRREMTLPHAAFGAILTLLLAAGITVARYGSGSVAAGESETAAAAKADDGFPGVILNAGRPARTAHIEPPDIAFAPRARDFSQPVSIPFTGEYWLFRPPNRRPPALSFHRDGTPADVWFTTTDGRPLAMEAEQTLADPAPMNCCSRIDVTVSGRELPPNTFAYLQLQLMDTRWNKYFWLDLGIRQLRGAGTESLPFDLASAGMIQKFDKLRVVYHPPRSRANQSLRLQIDRFVLIPR